VTLNLDAIAELAAECTNRRIDEFVACRRSKKPMRRLLLAPAARLLRGLARQLESL